ncbi:MAG TPA: hypothetical protein VI076_09800 [Actinopolymorphaceae bacterium]
MRLIKALASVATASALLVLSAAPTSATLHDLEITGGTLTTVSSPIVGPFDFGPGGTSGPCTNLATDVDTLTIDETGTGSPTSTTVTAASLTSSETSGTPSRPYALVITKHTGSNTGIITSAGAVSQNVSLKLELRSGCTTTDPLVCRIQANGNIIGTATAHPLTVSTDVPLAGTLSVSGILGQSCSVPFSSLVGSTATLSGLTLHVAT